PLTLRRFIAFYGPLALTSTLWLLWLPLVSATVSRMPDPLTSLAVWSVVSGLISIIRNPGVAYNEAVVALLEEPCSFPALRKFARTAALVIFGLVVIFVFTPLSTFWFRTVANLPVELAATARLTLGIAILISPMSVLIHFFQGIIVHQEKTRPVAEATAAFLLTLAVVLIIGVITKAFTGAYVAAAGYTLAHFMQGTWLMFRSHKQRKFLAHCERNEPVL
ncbi:MAG: hypothetical protein QM230_06780, partial [Chloroflexota bacterium]|nr:hypothetical protein [Chloroflexota bacterium]